MRVLVLMTVVAVMLNIFPDTWDDLRRTLRDHLGGRAQHVAATVERAADMDVHFDQLDEELFALAADTAGGVVSGTAVVIDGDTLKVGRPGTRVRLHGIDAPESGQRCRARGQVWPCGREATRALAQLIGLLPVACEERGRGRYGRVLAVCRVDGQDVNALMVEGGWALAYRRYSMDYVQEEAAARAAGRGIWRGEFVAPWDWRRGVRLEMALPPPPSDPAPCPIKGNINDAGERIYHVPGGRYYDATVISPAAGERWFCSEAEARDAGWRRSRR